jgi:hypothetical protein
VTSEPRHWVSHPDDAGFWIIDHKGTHDHRILRIGIMGDELMTWVPRWWLTGDQDVGGEAMVPVEHGCLQGSWWSEIRVPWGIDLDDEAVMEDPDDGP